MKCTDSRVMFSPWRRRCSSFPEPKDSPGLVRSVYSLALESNHFHLYIPSQIACWSGQYWPICARCNETLFHDQNDACNWPVISLSTEWPGPVPGRPLLSLCQGCNHNFWSMGTSSFWPCQCAKSCVKEENKALALHTPRPNILRLWGRNIINNEMSYDYNVS